MAGGTLSNKFMALRRLYLATKQNKNNNDEEEEGKVDNEGIQNITRQ